MEERRKSPRLVQPLEATWHGQSGAAACRIIDISWSGCFIQTLSLPSAGELTVVEFPVGDQILNIESRVLYVERNMGFAVTFETLTPIQLNVLTELLGEPST